MAKESSFTDTCFTHDDNRDVEADALNNQAHLKEIVDIDYISFLAVYFVLSVTRYVSQNLRCSFHPFVALSLFLKRCDILLFEQLIDWHIVNSLKEPVRL